MLGFFGDMDDIANAMDVYSELDGTYSKIEWQYGYSMQLDDAKNLNALVETMAITEYNRYGYDYKLREGKRSHMAQMQVP